MLSCNCNHETIYLPFAAALSSITPTLIWTLDKPAHTQGCFGSHANDILFVSWVTSILPRQHKVLTLPQALFWKLRIWTPTMWKWRKGSPLCSGKFLPWPTPISVSSTRTVRFDPPVNSRCYECIIEILSRFLHATVRLTVCKFGLWLAPLHRVQKKAGVSFEATLKKPWGQWRTKHYTCTLENIWLLMPFPQHSLQQESKSICALLIHIVSQQTVSSWSTITS